MSDSSPLRRRAVLVGGFLGAGVVVLAITQASGPDRPPTVHRARQGLNVRDFGAKGDGDTDDSAAFRGCLRAASRGGHSVHVPRGVYKLSEDGTSHACLRLPAKTLIYGEGTLSFASGVRKSVRLLDVAAPDIEIKGLKFNLESAPGGTSFAVTINDGALRTRVTDLHISNNPQRGGIQVLGGRDTSIKTCTITNMAQNGITLYGRGPGRGPDGVLIEDCVISAGVQPVDSEPVDGALCRNVTVRGCRLTSLGRNYALTLFGASHALVEDNTLTGALFMSTAKDVVVRRNVIDATASTDMNAIDGTYDATDCLVEHNTISAAPNRFGVRISRTQDQAPRQWRLRHNSITVSGATASGVWAKDAYGLEISDNTVTGTDSDVGINVLCTQGVMADTNVTANKVRGFSTGIWATSRIRGMLRIAVERNQVGAAGGRTMRAGLILDGPSVLAQIQSNEFTDSRGAPGVVRVP